MRKIDWDMFTPLIVIMFFGRFGTRNFRVAKTVAIEADPKSNPAFILTNPFLRLFRAPIRLVEPTTNNEYDVAIRGFNSNK